VHRGNVYIMNDVYSHWSLLSLPFHPWPLFILFLVRFLLQFFCLPAGGSGIPEVIGFLNGTIIRHVFTLRAFAVKFVSCMFAVGAGLPVGPEGPMIHIG